jgi:hypothetical protein
MRLSHGLSAWSCRIFASLASKMNRPVTGRTGPDRILNRPDRTGHEKAVRFQLCAALCPSITTFRSPSRCLVPTDHYLPLTLTLPCAHRSPHSPHPHAALCPPITTFSSPSRCLVPTDHYLLLTLTLPCAH